MRSQATMCKYSIGNRITWMVWSLFAPPNNQAHVRVRTKESMTREKLRVASFTQYLNILQFTFRLNITILDDDIELQSTELC
jgi:hypothetical protein